MNDRSALVASLSETRMSGKPPRTDAAAPKDLDDALRLQLEVLEALLASGEELAGWKIGLTSERVRQRLGREERPFGYLLASGVHESGERVELEAVSPAAGVEPELCFEMGTTLPAGDVTPEQARGAVARVNAGMEINAFRSDGSSFESLVADDLAQWGIVVGSGGPITADFSSSAVDAVMTCDGREEATARGAEVIDDHFVSLAILANTLGRFGRRLEAGQRVITGSFSAHKVKQPGHWHARFSGVGEVEIHFG